MNRPVFGLILFLQAMFAFGQWDQQYSGTSAPLYDVCFVDTEHGFAVGKTGTILKTVDGGSNWEQIDGGVTFDYVDLRAVRFLNRDTGFIVGNEAFSGGIILRTMDGGTTWDLTELTGSYLYLYDVDFSDPDTWIAVGGLSNTCIMYRTTNGGNDWAQVPLNRNGDLLSVCFPVPDTGYAAGGYAWNYEESNDLIFRSTDAGATWTLVDSLGPMKFSIEFSDATYGYCVGWHGWMHLTTDGGITWTYQHFPSYELYGLSFPSHDTGYMLGYSNTDSCDVVFRTTDAGMTWWPLGSDTSYPLSTIFFPANDTGYAVGGLGLILKTENGGGFPVGVQNNSNRKTEIKITPNPATDRITIETPSDGVILIYSFDGTVTRKIKPTVPLTTIDILRLPVGIYVVNYSGTNKVAIGKLVKL